jgi:DNA topoisomerase-1
MEIRRRHINGPHQEAMGEPAKDFRTWAGTLICACLLSQAGDGEEESVSSRKKAVVKAVRETAESLGNTPAVCRKSYIAPRVLRSYEKGKVIEACAVPPRKLMTRRYAPLAPAEKAVLKLLSDR